MDEKPPFSVCPLPVCPDRHACAVKGDCLMRGADPANVLAFVKPSLEQLVRRRNRAAQAVRDWLNVEAVEGRYRHNVDAPGWDDYRKAQDALDKGLDAIGTDDPPPPPLTVATAPPVADTLRELAGLLKVATDLAQALLTVLETPPEVPPDAIA